MECRIKITNSDFKDISIIGKLFAAQTLARDLYFYDFDKYLHISVIEGLGTKT